MKILNTVICYKNEEEVLEYAKSIYQQEQNQDIVLVVVINERGNMSDDLFKTLLNSVGINIFICTPDKNLGYLNGMIYGYEKYAETNNNIPQWVIMSNTDISFRDSLFIKSFINKEYDCDIWCVGPSIYSPSKGSYDNPASIERRSIRKINTLIFIFSYSWLASQYFKLSKIKSRKNSERQKSRFVYEVHGCFFILKYEFAEFLKNKKYGAFLFSEEAFIAELARLNNKKIYYESEIEVVHNEHSVTSKMLTKRKAILYVESLTEIKKEFYC